MAKAKTAGQWQAVIDDLAVRIDASEVERATLRDGKRQDALGAATGDQAAQRRLATVNASIRDADGQLDDLRTALEQAERALAGARADEALAGHQQRLAEVRALARQRVEVAKRLQVAIDALGKPLDELAMVSDQLGSIIEDGTEADAVCRWRNAVRDALASLLSERGIDDMGLAVGRAPLADALAIGAAGWSNQIIDQLAQRAAGGVAAELAA